MIQINDLKFSYGSKAVLDSITMNLEEGKIYGLLGENGVGKTTLLTLIAGLKKVEAGSISIDGVNPWRREPSTLSELCYLPDEVIAFAMTPRQYASAYGKMWEHFSDEVFEKLLEELEVPTEQMMNKMSCGQLKKTHIAFCIACRAKYLLLDEPTNGLDIPSKAQFRSAIMKYSREESTLVISTHQVRDLESLIDPIIILDKKDVLLNASIEEIASKLYFDYSSTVNPSALYSEMLPGAFVQVAPNMTGAESKVNIEALFNTVHAHKDVIKSMFKK